MFKTKQIQNQNFQIHADSQLNCFMFIHKDVGEC